MAEFELIARIARRAQQRPDVLLGIGDDAALLAPPSGQALVVSADLLNEGVHFRAGDSPFDVGWKSLAVNLSDLAAMGAEPAWALLTLSLPDANEDWLDGFIDGFFSLADAHRLALVGGDTTRGPRSIGVTVHGFVDARQALRRDAAQVGDDLWVTGTLGDAAGGLRAKEDHPELLRRLHRPEPRVAAGLALRGLARAAIDVSDGLFADLSHVLEASGVGAQINLQDLPCSVVLQSAFSPDVCRQLQCAGGDDYELCFSAAREQRSAIVAAMATCATSVSRVGEIIAGSGIRALDEHGQPWQPRSAGFLHFESAPE